MDFSSCPLYRMSSKKSLKHMLGISDNRLLKQNYICKHIFPFIDKANKPRLLEPPSKELKSIQKRIKNMLSRIDVPENVFSGIKGRSYVDNAKIHSGKLSLFKIDLSAFFPSISRETVFHFFANDLLCSPDIAKILTDLTTVNLDSANIADVESVNSFLVQKGITCTNHLISGSPSRQILSYLANHNMFNQMQEISNKNGILMSIYVDDIVFSSDHGISREFKNHILYIVKKFGYKTSINKVRSYTDSTPKLVTGVVINPEGRLTVKNSIRHKIIEEFIVIKDDPSNYHSKKRLTGLISAAKQVDKSIFPSIYNYVWSVGVNNN